MTDFVAQIRALIDFDIAPDIPHRRLVLKLTGRIPDPILQGDLNEALNDAIDELRLDNVHMQGSSSDQRVRAHDLLDRIVAAGRN